MLPRRVVVASVGFLTEEELKMAGHFGARRLIRPSFDQENRPFLFFAQSGGHYGTSSSSCATIECMKPIRDEDDATDELNATLTTDDNEVVGWSWPSDRLNALARISDFRISQEESVQHRQKQGGIAGCANVHQLRSAGVGVTALRRRKRNVENGGLKQRIRFHVCVGFSEPGEQRRGTNDRERS